MSLSIPHCKNSISAIQNDHGNISNVDIGKFLYSGKALVISIGDFKNSTNRCDPNFGLKIVYEKSTEDIALLDSYGQIFILNLADNYYRKIYKNDGKISALSFANMHPASLLICFSTGDILRLNYTTINEASVEFKSKFKITSINSHPSE